MFGCLVFGLFSEGYLYWIFQNGSLLQVVDLESVMNMSHVRRFSTSLFLGRFFEWTCSANVTQKLEVFASFPNVPVDFASRQWFLDFWTEWQWHKNWHQSAFCWNHLSKLLKKPACLGYIRDEIENPVIWGLFHINKWVRNPGTKQPGWLMESKGPRVFWPWLISAQDNPPYKDGPHDDGLPEDYRFSNLDRQPERQAVWWFSPVDLIKTPQRLLGIRCHLTIFRFAQKADAKQ